MNNSDEYRANAHECNRMASISSNPDEKAIWLQMAEGWLWKAGIQYELAGQTKPREGGNEG